MLYWSVSRLSGLFFFLMSLLPAVAAAQFTPDYEVLITTVDGRALKGRSVRQDSTGYQFWLKSARRETMINNDQIDRIDTLGLWSPPVGSYLNQVGPNTGYGLKKGEFYWRSYMLTANFAAVGITDYFSIGAGFDIASSILTASDHTFTYAIAPKFSIPVRKDLINVGVGGIFLNLPDYEGGFSTHNFYHATFTVGSRSRNFSTGLAMVQVEGNLRPSPVYTLNMNWSVKSFFALQAEILTGAPIEGTLVLPGIQLIGRRLDFNLTYPLGWNVGSFYYSPFPLGALSFKIGRP
jgi:hypothetical protein